MLDTQKIEDVRSLLDKEAAHSGVFITFEEVIKEKIKHLRTCFPQNYSLLYSAKANYFPPLLECFKGLVEGFDVCSPGLLKLVPDKDFLINYTGPLKKDVQRVPDNVVFSVDSLSEAQALYERNTPLNIIVRWNTHGKSQFGLRENELSEMQKYTDRLRIRGYHAYFGPQRQKISDIEADFKKFLSYEDIFSRAFKVSPELRIYGAGFGVKMFERERDIAPEDIATIFKKYDDKRKIHLELGRYLVAESTWYVTRVIHTRVVDGLQIVTVNGGFSHHMVLTSMVRLLRGNPLVRVLADTAGRKEKRHKIVGASCYEQDVLADEIVLPELRTGDLICFPNAGAYAKTFSPGSFLCMESAKEYFIKNKES